MDSGIETAGSGSDDGSSESDNEDSGMLIYTTSRKISVTPAKLAEIIYVNNGEGVISPVSLSEPKLFFADNGGVNLQKHLLTVSCGELLSVGGACTVTVELTQTSHFAEADTAKLLSGSSARWYWLSERGPRPLIRRRPRTTA